ncbi:MAG TPA: lipid-A-disaccharide synthase, partial [Bacteroidales bacterium]|nr:lipid-A-disaccharide synthase [Bacteroidales bacterium]
VMRYFIIAGEQSGDLHGSNLVRELIIADKEAEIVCWGGDMMESAGAKLLMHYKKTAFMGFVVILKNLRTIAHNLSLCKQQIKEFSPDVVILIDYPGFNLRIAEYAKNSGIRVFYYISPKFWAWKEKRVEKIKRYVEKMYIIFPFETSFYKKHQIEVEYRGNPLVDETDRRISAMFSSEELRKAMSLDGRPVIGILAGSRRHEVESILPQMVRVIRDFPGYQFVLAGVKNLPDELYLRIIGNENVKLIKEKTYEILHISEAALVASGTATLEAALLNTPQVVCYKADFLSMLIALMLIKVKFISLVNLIMDAEVVKELLGYSVNRKNIARELKSVLHGGEKREKMLSDYILMKQILGPAGASARVAADMVKVLGK